MWPQPSDRRGDAGGRACLLAPRGLDGSEVRCLLCISDLLLGGPVVVLAPSPVGGDELELVVLIRYIVGID